MFSRLHTQYIKLHTFLTPCLFRHSGNNFNCFITNIHHIMRKKYLFLIAIYVMVMSCTKEKTNYEAEIDHVSTEDYEFKEAEVVNIEGYNVHIEALNGMFYKGYNEIRLKIKSSENTKASAVTFLPILFNEDGDNASCPHRYELTYIPDGDYFSGYAVFITESNGNAHWKLYLSFSIADKTHTFSQEIIVQEQVNKNLNMTSFIGEDEEQYIIALVSPQRPKVAENELVAGIYKFNKPTAPASGYFPDPAQFSYTEVKEYTLLLDPRMPEASMGNHSSPNNKDLIQQHDGLYHGVVNYTMTGNWTLNFIMLDQNGRILKGTEVPTDFTPGVEGIKSELHIDILL